MVLDRFRTRCSDIIKTCQMCSTVYPASGICIGFFKRAYDSICTSDTRCSALSNDEFKWRQLCHHFLHNNGKHSDARNKTQAYAEVLFPFSSISIDSARKDNPNGICGSVVKDVNNWILCVMESDFQSCPNAHRSCVHRSKTTNADSEIALSWFTYESEQDRNDLEMKASSFFLLPADVYSISSAIPNHLNKKVNTAAEVDTTSNTATIASSTMII